MKTALSPAWSRRWLALVLWLGADGSLSAQVDPVLYRAVRGSTFESQPPGDVTPAPIPMRVRGTFLMTPQISPLDWDNYLISDLRLEVLTDEGAPPVLRGHGYFGQSSRFNQMRLVLDVDYRGSALHLDSGQVPVESWEPGLDITAKGTVEEGSGAGSYALHLAAVPELARWHYRLVEGSLIVDDCPICGRPTLFVPARGGFDLVLIDENPLISRYHLFDLEIEAGTDYRLEGEGDYEVGGEVAIRQQLRLEVEVVSPGAPPRDTVFVEAPGTPARRWPMLSADVTDTQGTALLLLSLQLRAAPFRELWFSTAHGLTSGNAPWPDNRYSSGDLLADTGRRIRTNADLIRALGWSDAKAPLPIDAPTVAPGGEVWFSFREPQTSPTLGPIGDGDLVSERGRVVARNAALIAPFGLQPPVPDLGLDGVQLLEGGEILFSITQQAFSEKLGLTLLPGDILSNGGEVRHAAKALLAAFAPEAAEPEPGVDAFFVWPSGEVWFSTETGFSSQTVGTVMDGDLLSDQGYVVYRNLELVQAYQPLEDLANFGLDGLFVVTDATPPVPGAELALSWPDEPTGPVRLDWVGKGRVYQIERTMDLADPFVAVSPILPASSWTEPPGIPPGARRFYRLRQW